MSVFSRAAVALDDEYKDLFLAKKAMEDGFYDVAQRQLEKFMEEYPNSRRIMEVKFLSGQCYFKEGNLYKASVVFESLFKQGEKVKPVNPDEVLFWLAETYLKGKDYERALNFYKKTGVDFPQSQYCAAAAYNCALCLYEMKNFPEALNAFRKFLAKYPSGDYASAAEYKIGEILFESKEYEKAKAYLIAYMDKHDDPKNLTRANCLLGEIYYKQADYKQAVKYYRNCLEQDNRSFFAPYARYGLGWAYFDAKRYQESLAAFEEFMEFSSRHELAELVMLQIGECHRMLKDGQKALTVFDEAIKKFANGKFIQQAYYLKARVLFEMEKYGDSIAVLKELLKNFPQGGAVTAQAHYQLGLAYLKTADPAQALNEFTKAADSKDDIALKVNAMSKIADMHMEAGDIKQAQQLYDKIINDFSDANLADYAQYQLGISFLKENRFDAAILALQNVMRNFPKSRFFPAVLYHIGVAYFKKGNFEVACKHLNEMAGNYPDSEFRDKALFYAATSCYNLKQFDQALKTYSQLIRETKDSELLWSSFHQRAWCYYNMGKEKEAINAFVECLNKFPNIPIAADIRLWLGQYYFQNEKFDKARDYFTAVINGPACPELKEEAMFQLGLSFEKTGNYKKAIRQFKLLERLFPKSVFVPECLVKSAEIYLKKNKNEIAKLKLKRLIRTYPDSSQEAMAYKKLSDIAVSEKDFSLALEYLDKAMKNPQNTQSYRAQLQYETGVLWESAGDTKRAVEEYLKVVYLYPKMTSLAGMSYMSAARIFEGNNEFERAESIYEKIIENNFNEKEKAKERIRWIKEKINI